MQPCTQAVILAAGKGTRMKELVQSVPKPMLTVQGKNLLEWKIDMLPESVTEVIFVIGYLGHVIRDYFGDNWKGRTIKYVEQGELNGTGGALIACRDLLNGRFLVMMGDDLYGAADIENILKHENAIAIKARENFSGGAVIKDENGNLVTVTEGTHEKGFFNAALYVLDMRFFDYPPVAAGNGHSTEIGLPQTMMGMTKDVTIACYEMQTLMQITSPEDLIKAESEWIG